MPRLQNRLVIRSVVAAALLAAVAPRPAAAFRYANNFETNSAGFTLISTTASPGVFIPAGYTVAVSQLATTANSTPPGPQGDPSSRYLGANNGPARNQQFGFSGRTLLNLNLSGLTVGNTYDVSFDLFIGGSWEGNALPPVYPPDRYRFTANGQTLIDTTFNTYGPNDLTPGIPTPFATSGQSYSDNDLTGYNNGSPSFHTPFSGAEVAYDNPRSTNPATNYSIYKFGLGRGDGSPRLSFVATSTNATFQWRSDTSVPQITNEYWALDNVIVTELPEPGTLGMMALGLIPLGVGLYRARRK